MSHDESNRALRHRQAPLAITTAEFRQAGHALVDQLAGLLDSVPGRRVSPVGSPSTLRALLGDGILPETGRPAGDLLKETTELLFDHSLFNGHPRFWGYITAAPAPIGMLADLLAAAVNPNVGAWALSPLATEIETQTVRWIAELIGYPAGGGGILVSGGNMANFVGFLAARRARLEGDVRNLGLQAGGGLACVYVSQESHVWVQKAADLFGFGLDALRWIPTDEHQRLDPQALEQQILADRQAGHLPFLAVGAAGTVGVGAVDPLPAVSEICRRHGLWFHVDGAYGAPAAALPEASADLHGLSLADSVAVDPHKWLYAPLEAGCTLVRDRQHLIEAFSFHPEYYNFEGSAEDVPLNYYELGPQNSRGFRALKVWLALRQVGRQGYLRMVRDDIALAVELHRLIRRTEELQAFTQNLSITTFRYVPEGIRPGEAEAETYLNDLNRDLVNRLQAEGEAYVSNALVNGAYVLRACIVNFRTQLSDIEALPGIVVRLGRSLHAERRPAAPKAV
jgi:glutamate/tyrosine decarboxylase-like PLP-dependent enzyme